MKQGFIKRSSDNPGAVLNTDSAGLKHYKKMKNKYKKTDNEIKELRQQVDELFRLLKEKDDNKSL